MEHFEKYPGGVVREPMAGSEGYDLWTAHKGFAVLLHEGNERKPWLEINSPLYGNVPVTSDDATGFSGCGEFVNYVVRSSLGIRGFDVSQLSKTTSSSTIPNAQYFKRIQTTELVHLYNEVMERSGLKLTEEARRQHVAYQLLEDLFHYDFSHGLELPFQGWSGPQTASTSAAEYLLKASGLIDRFPWLKGMIAKNGALEPGMKLDCLDAQKDPETGVPGFDFDKLHYVPSEIALWFADYESPALHELLLRAASPEAVFLNDQGELVFKDIDVALFLSKCLLLLSTEHWNEIMQRMQIFAINEAFLLSVRSRSLAQMTLSDGRPVDGGETIDPRSYVYGGDSSLDHSLLALVQKGEPYAVLLTEILKTVGMQERGKFLHNKRPVFADFLTDHGARDFPSSIGLLVQEPGHKRKYGLVSPYYNITALDPSTTEKLSSPLPVFEKNKTAFTLTTLKYRSIDPLVRANGKDVRLSAISATYAGIMRQHAQVHRAPMQVELVISDEYKRCLRSGHSENKKFLDEQCKKPRVSVDMQRLILKGVAERTKAVSITRGLLTVDDR
jgi:hypothetical protein